MAIFMQFGQIKGEVTEPGHEGWVELQSLQWGVCRGMQLRAGKMADRESIPSVSEIVVTKAPDDASIDLTQEALFGKGQRAEIHFTRTRKGKQEVYLTYLMESCVLSGYAVGSSSERPVESLTLNFSAIEFIASRMGRDGSAAGPTKNVTYDLATADAA